MPSNEVQLKCTVKKIFKNCPKSDGWYGFFAYVPKLKRDVKITGITSLVLKEQMQLEITAVPDPKSPDDSFIMKDVTIITRTQKSIIAYLSSLKGIGRFTAQRIVSEFGADAIKEIENNIDHVRITCGLTQLQADELTLGVFATNETNKLQKFLPELTPKQIEYVRRNLKDPIKEVSDNPYVLTRIPTIGFKRADDIALRLGFDPISPFRVNHGIVYLLKTCSGLCEHCYLNLSDDDTLRKLYTETENLLNVRFIDYKEFGNRICDLAAIPDSPIKLEKWNLETHLYLCEMYYAVQAIVRILKTPKPQPYQRSKLQTFLPAYEQNKRIKLSLEQKTAVETSLTNPISVITGGPGRGKTMLIDCIASAWDKGTVYLLAPTGKAANKLNIATSGRYSVTTMTIDKLITLLSLGCDKAQTAVLKNTHVNSEHNLVIVDESSMIDTKKAAHLLSCCEKCNFIFVGDIDQLPAIEPGTFFKDVIDSGVIPVSKLTIPMRNAGKILENADKINKNDINLSYDFMEMPFYPYEKDDQTLLDAVIDQYNIERSRTPDIKQIALLSPIKKGFAGTVKLNIAIQNIICPAAADNTRPSYDQRRSRNNYVTKGFIINSQFYGNSSDYTKYRVGDIVINTQNCPDITVYSYTYNDYWNGNAEKRTQGIFNGDCGTIIAYVPDAGDQTEMIVIQLFDGRIIEIDCSAGEFESFQLGYAMTVHKAQGCEYETVIYISPDSIQYCVKTGFASKNIVYTAVTRAKNRMIIMGSKNGLHACIQNNQPVRNSTLAQKLR